MSAVNGIGWFEIATDEPAVAERFYADVFGWTYGNDRGEATGADDMAYRMVTPPGAERPAGGIFPTGGKVLLAPKTTPDGLSFAHLLDPSGNHFGVFTPPPAGE
jgi:predicted enzyme related to lactoylglutathione lyase